MLRTHMLGLPVAQHLPRHLLYDILKHFSSSLITAALNQFPWYLAHICSSWRAEFLSMHRMFWSYIYIDFPRPYSPTYKSEADRCIEVLKMFLERNRGHSFSFEVAVGRGEKESTSRAQQIMDMLISASARWRRATIDVDSHNIRKLPRIKGRVNQLESMVLIVGGPAIYQTNNVDTFLDAPYLTRLTLHRLSKWNFSWERMTLLEFQILEAEEAARLPFILSQAVQLETLIAPSYFPVRSAFITVPNLKHLDLGCIDLLSIITAPVLETLTTSMTVGGSTRLPTEILESFLRRSRCQIQNLEVTGWLDSATATDIFSHAPEITRLTLYHVPNVGRVLKLFNEMPTPKLARLQSLSLIECQLSRDEVDEVFKFVSLRKKRIKNAGFVIEKLQKLTFGKAGNEEGPNSARRELRKHCKSYGIQYSAPSWSTPFWHAHDESQDPYDHSHDIYNQSSINENLRESDED
ncbi:hypothetical protein APHAL10511_003334 [Amanita phalloides]|nr:hypothetical protein APHAL10511_003334 [Amanita phalloides]